MKQALPNILAFAIGLPVFAAGTLAAAEPDWSFAVSPYLWVAGVDLETSVPSSPSTVHRFDTRICAGAMLTAEVQYKCVGLLVDFAWLRLNTEAINPGPAFSAVDLKSDFIHATAALTYRLPSAGKLHANILAGARVWYVNEDLEFTGGVLPGFNSSADKVWADPLIGANLRYDLSPRWFIEAKGTVGGFGVSADLAWEVFAGAGYRINDWCVATLGYRYLHEDYDRSQFSFNLDAHGFLLGFGFHF
jgi:hypothetical protein